MERDDLLTFKTIGNDLAFQMQQEAIAVARNLGVSGFVVVYSRTGTQECSRAVGPNAKPLNVQIALAKIETVLARRESTGRWQAKIMKTGTRPENYAGAVKTLFGGGLAIFADKAHQEFVGAIAFSGGEEWQDIQICYTAIEKAGLYTDEIEK